jgi:hypothetical protein
VRRGKRRQRLGQLGGRRGQAPSWEEQLGLEGGCHNPEFNTASGINDRILSLMVVGICKAQTSSIFLKVVNAA